ncbi:MAG TPA: Ldh family oxidoreductase [Syntrophomonadaceae bacterium]|nr:Ldh family oxidoreductase [Syntrophomonadaceae bacterium]
MQQEIFPSGVLKEFAVRVLEAAGVDPEESEVVADNLVTANLRGIDSHGIVRLPLYVERLEAGLIARRTKIDVVRDAPAACVLDANNGWGAVAGLAGIRQAIEKARRSGVGVAVVRNSNHFGIAAYYAQEAVAETMIGVSMTNASANMAPWGGCDPYFGTNPICVAVPAGKERPVIYDGATSVVAIGKIVLAAKKGEPIPLDWALDGRGNPTTDPGAVMAGGTLLPLGGYKGYGLALMVDVLSGILSGAAFGPYVSNLRRMDAPQNVGHFFAALNISAFLDPQEFLEDMERLVEDIKHARLAAGSREIYLPGEIEWNWEERRRREGIPVPEGVLEELRALGERYRVDLPCE